MGVLNNKNHWQRMDAVRSKPACACVVRFRTVGNDFQKRKIFQIEIHISDVNDNPPVFRTTKTYYTAMENIVGPSIGVFTATDVDLGSNGNVIYEISSESYKGKDF